MRELSAARVAAEWARARGIVTWVVAALLLSTVAMAALGILAIMTIPATLPVPAMALMLAPLLIMINGLFRAACAALRALGADDLGLTIENLLMPAIFLAPLIAGEMAIPRVLGAAFADSLWPMDILSLPLAVNVLVTPITLYQSHSGVQRTIARFQLAAAAANIPLNALLIPPFGVQSAATATMVSYMIVHGLVWQRWHWLPIHRLRG